MGVAVMADGPGPQLFWRVLDALDFWLTQARLWVADAVCGPDPDTPADRARLLLPRIVPGNPAL
jgi:hypothetical protein